MIRRKDLFFYDNDAVKYGEALDPLGTIVELEIDVFQVENEPYYRVRATSAELDFFPCFSSLLPKTQQDYYTNSSHARGACFDYNHSISGRLLLRYVNH